MAWLELTKMLAHPTVRAVEFFVQREPVSIHLRFCLVADVKRASVVFWSESGDFRFAESDDLPCFGIDDFAEAVAFYCCVVLGGEGQVKLAVCPHGLSVEKVFGNGAGADVLHAMFVEVDCSGGMFWVRGIAVG